MSNSMLKWAHPTTRGQANITTEVFVLHTPEAMKNYIAKSKKNVIIMFLIESLNALHSRIIFMFRFH